MYDILLRVFKKYEIYKGEITEELLSFYLEILKEEENIKKEEMIKKEIKVLENKKDKLLDLALNELFSKEELQIKKVSIEKEISCLNTKLKELEVKTEKREDYNKILEENILKKIEITRDNLEVYIEELLDKIIVENLEEESEVNLKIILVGNNVIKYRIPTKK